MTDKENNGIGEKSAIDHRSPPIVLVDDEQPILDSFRIILLSEGISDVKLFTDSRDIMTFLAVHGASLIVTDLRMPHTSGEELLDEVQRDFPHIPVIVMTAVNDLETAVRCIKKGAFDYLVKPVEKSRFVSSIRRALELNEFRNEAERLRAGLLKRELKHKEAFSPVITKNEKMFNIFHYIEAIACSRSVVLITGETGVGKELIARAIHQVSNCRGSFIAVNVAGLDDAMLSDTLFGHDKGAFTGADQRRQGLIRQAAEGSLFLDEIGDLNEASQVKLLRLIQERTYFPLGSDLPRRSNARLITATNRDLGRMIAEGKFRKDLYYRLSSHHISIPPLRERPEDIPLLLNYLIKEAANSMNKKRPSVTPELERLLSNYPFPGNVRELQAMVYDAVARHQSGIMPMERFKDAVGNNASALQTDLAAAVNSKAAISCNFSRFPTIKEVEAYFMEEALKRSNGNMSMAASMLGISRQAVSKKVSKRQGKGASYRPKLF